MSEEQSFVVAKEQIVVHKYDGDLTEEEMKNAEPIETVVIEDGKIVDVIRREDTSGSN